MEDSFETNEILKMVESCQLLLPEEQNQLAEDLRCEENFSSFLLFVFRSLAEEFRSDFIFLGGFIWEVYLIASKNTCKVKPILEKMKAIMDIHMDPLATMMKSVCVNPSNKATMKPFSTLINGLVQVSAFVIEGYFESGSESLSDELFSDTSDKNSKLSGESKSSSSASSLKKK